MTIGQIISQQINYFPSAGFRQFYIECNSNRGEAIDEIKNFQVVGCYNGFNAILVSFVDNDLSKTQIIFYDQYYLFIGKNIASIVPGFIDHLTDDIQASAFNALIRDPKIS